MAQPVTPTIEDLQAAIKSAYLSNPMPAGAPSLLKKIKNDNPTWALSLQRLKKVMADTQQGVDMEATKNINSSGGTRQTSNAAGQDDNGPKSDALEEQLKYQKTSTRYYRIIGNDGYDYGVTFNADMAVLFNATQERAIEDPGQRAVSLYHMYEQLSRAAEKAGVPKENLRQQLWSEFGCDPLLAAPPPPRTAVERALVAKQEEAARQSFKEHSLSVKREMLKIVPGARKYIPVDGKGEPIWNEARNGRWAVLVTKLRKGNGLEELETR